jgi:hypothetical protein
MGTSTHKITRPSRKYRVNGAAQIAIFALICGLAFALDKLEAECRILPVSAFMMVPFAVLLLSVAAMPFCTPGGGSAIARGFRSV